MGFKSAAVSVFGFNRWFMLADAHAQPTTVRVQVTKFPKLAQVTYVTRL